MTNWVTVNEAAANPIYSHIHITTLLRKKKISGRKSGVMWLVDLDSLKDYEKKMQALGPHKHNPKSE